MKSFYLKALSAFFTVYLLSTCQPVWALDCKTAIHMSKSKVREFNQFLTEIFTSDFREISTERSSHSIKIESIVELPENRSLYEGTVIKSIYEARLNGERVILKFGNSNIKEAKWLIALNKLGLGPRYYGHLSSELVKKMPDLPQKAIVIVMENIENGINSKSLISASENYANFQLKNTMLEEMSNTAIVLERFGIMGTVDLQFLLTESGRAILMDVETFHRVAVTSNSTPKKAVESIITKLLKDYKIHP